jgi:L-lysine 6-transaminase
MAEQTHLQPAEVHEVLARHVLTDGMKLVLDLRRSRGSRLVDARTGDSYLDMYTFFASAPLGLNPPGLADDPTFVAELGEIAVNKPANPDMYSTAYAEFVETFVRVLGDRRWSTGSRKRPQGRVRLEEPEERGGRAGPKPRHPDHASDPGVPWP